MVMSKLIRERKIGTTVAKGALCASSCPIILSGGVSRSADDGAVVGVHQVFNGTKEKLSPERAMPRPSPPGIRKTISFSAFLLSTLVI